MKTIVTCMILGLMMTSGQRDSLGLMFWNVENFFDWHDSLAGDADKEFSSFGAKRWTKRRFNIKCAAIAKAVFSIADEHGSLPAAICFAEVENRYVLKNLIRRTALRKCDYEIVHYDSPDPRGIDVALMYDTTVLTLVHSRPCGLDSILTRDILLCQFITGSGDSLAVLVNHHPSKYGGDVSIPRREAAVALLWHLSDSLRMEGWRSQVALGDFNDTPDSPLYRALEDIMVNISAAAAANGEGTIRFDGKWELIDQCFATPELSGSLSFHICALPFLTVRDNAYSGQKPFRTYSGPKYNGGVSDHYPIYIDIIQN